MTTAIVCLGLLALAWFVLLPERFGGHTDYVIVSGASMAPTLHHGDLVVLRRHRSYRAGDIITFRVPKDEPAPGAKVIHRIVGGNGRDGFVVKGDNKPAPDIWRPRARDVLGRLWLRMPGAGRWLTRLRQPVVLASLAAAVATVSVLLWKPKPRQPRE